MNIMKKYIFMAVAAAAMLFSSCEKVKTTEVSGVDTQNKVTVRGYARYVVTDSKGSVKKPELLENTPLILYYGTKSADGKTMSYVPYDLKTDADGYFTIDLALEPGKVVIDEVKVVCSFSREEETYAYNEKTSKWVQTDADFFGEVAKQNLAAGNSYYYDLLVAAVAYTSSPDLVQPK